ncbi:MAG: SpoIIE family protein phosphatase [Actinobacteria bacterium]|nr:SpoIIE family protein phosphatase [Actinomycetota bacterium]
MTWVVMLVALLCGSVAAAVVWRITENDAEDRRRAATDQVIDAARRVAADMIVTLSGSSALVDDSGTVTQGALDRLAADLHDADAGRPVAWLTPDGAGGWTVSGAVLDQDDAQAAALLQPGATLPPGSDLAAAATKAKDSTRPTIAYLSPSATDRDPARIAVLKPVFRTGTTSTDGAAPEISGVIASVSPANQLGGSMSRDLDPDVHFSVTEDGAVIATSDPPPTGGMKRTIVLGGSKLEVTVQDDRPVKHDLSWFLLWISAIVVAAAGTAGLRSARYDEDRRRTNMLIGRTAELAQHLARAATAGDVADVISKHLPGLLGAEIALYGQVDPQRHRVQIRHASAGSPVLDRVTDVEIGDVPALADALRTGEIAIMRTPEEWRGSFPRNVSNRVLTAGATTSALLPLEVGADGVVATVGIVWTTAPEIDQRMLATLDTVKELTEQTLERTELTDRMSMHASQLAILAEELTGADTVTEAVETITRLAPGPVGATEVHVGLRGDDRFPNMETPDQPEDPARVVVLPLRADGSLTGSIGFVWADPVTLDDDRVNDLTTVAEMTAQTLRRAHLVEQLRGSVARNQALAEFAQQVANVRNTAELCSVVVAHAAAGVGASVADIGLATTHGTGLSLRPDPLPSPELVPTSAQLDPPTPSVECLRTNKPVLVSGVDALNGRYAPAVRDELRRHGITRTAHLPLNGPDGTVLGVLGVGWVDEIELSETIWAKLRTLGELCSQAFQRVRLAEAEHRLAVSLQERVVRPMPSPPHLAIADRYLPAAEQVGMGGDWFEGIRIDEHRFAVVVGDIAGHGINAVADMVELRAIIGSLLRSSTPLGELYPQVADLLRLSGSALTATSCAAVFDTASHIVEYVSAGHLPPVIVDPAGQVRLLTDGRQPLLGVPSSPVAAGRAPFPPGSVMAMYTDGIVERRGEAIDASLRRLEAAAGGLLQRTTGDDTDGPVPAPDVEQLADGLLRRCLDGRPTDDDVALVVIMATDD